MPLITLMSDFGYCDHYTAAIKAKIYTINPNISTIDISHHIKNFNLAHGAFVLKSVFRDFPESTVHLIAIDSTSSLEAPYVALQLEGHFFIGTDNGLFRLISEETPANIVQLDHPQTNPTSFPAKEILAPAAAALAGGTPLADLGEPLTEIKSLFPRQIKATKKEIAGNVVQIDHYGNLITNIDKPTFDFLKEGKKFRILFGRESFNKIQEHYQEADYGDCFLIFNNLNLLEIGINKGNARELLGLEYDSPVKVVFEE